MNNRRSSREGRKRGIRETIPGRIPKKNRGRSDSNGSSDGQREEEGAVTEKEEEMLDPVAAARKALEMFEEVSGEAVVHTIKAKNNSNKTAKVPDIGGQRSSEERQRYKKSNSKTSNQRMKSKAAEQSEQTEEEKAEERRKIGEEKARQKERIEAGEAKRKEFRPKIVSLQDSNCLL
mmetsp:Transcript_239/g.593  ORF Transcript_239/g.593 Transcript_239/m.593 type:complete len:177 (+) Transcript_239:522-1052(+)|eukprot:CAMPEP_0168202360 /NCGR_PEP_ID=MMETSP0139_2-20121125/24227_1 /TAXON_ID=44445 /ORGANISM="Pseudo-nitzschia australis, Strain 10249 10 AB" /LENGTH=176 /DNA_ID=CAMNT_0008128035 /DNA_START=409 /DNA_END=939 /DNA_ORIENTATION=-